MLKRGARDISLDFLRILSIFGVIIIHSIATMVVSSPIGSKRWMAANIIDSAVRWCVPVFIMISGSLLIKPGTFNDRKFFLRKRIIKIVSAIIIWPIIYILWNWIETGAKIDLHAYAYSILTGTPAPGHLYFLFLILGLYLLTPIINLYVENITTKELRITVGVLFIITTAWQLVVSFVPGQQGAQALNFATQGLPYVGYYIAGYILKDFRPKMNHLPLYALGYAASVSSLSIATLLLSQHFGIDKGLSLYSYVSVPVIIMSLCIFILLRALYFLILDKVVHTHKILSTLSNATFGVYLVHMIILSGLVNHFHISLLSYRGVAVTFILTALVSYATSLLMLRSRFLKIIIS